MKSIPAALRDVSRAFEALAQAYEAQGHAQAVVRRKAEPKPDPEPPRLDLAVLEEPADREGLTKTETKILTALAQAGHALSAVQIGTRCGLSSKGGAFAKALTGLRSAEYIAGGAARVEITEDGLEALGPFARLPEGAALFDYWCHKVGTTGAKVLGALRQQQRELRGPTSSAALGDLTGLSHKGGAFAAVLTKLRKLELIEGGASGMVLSPELQRAAEVTVGVFDRKSGATVRVNRRGAVAT